MEPKAAIIMGSVSDMKIMEEAAKVLDQLGITFERKALSAHRTPDEVKEYVSSSKNRGMQVIIAGAGGAAHLPGVIASFTTLPVIGVPCRSSISPDGWDSVLSILQMPPGIPVATVGLDAARNAGILAAEIIALNDEEVAGKIITLREQMKEKVLNSNKELDRSQYRHCSD